jgi:hypothetical protein
MVAWIVFYCIKKKLNKKESKVLIENEGIRGKSLSHMKIPGNEAADKETTVLKDDLLPTRKYPPQNLTTEV